MSRRFAIRARDLKTCIVKWDCHVHTHYTDGKPSVAEASVRAVELGLERIIFTEHTEPWQAKRADWFTQYLQDIALAQQQYASRLDIVAGLEAPATDFNGGLELSDEMTSQIDFLLGAAHRYPDLGARKVRELDLRTAIDMEFRTLMALAVDPRIDAIAHIGATCAKYCGPFPDELSREVIRTATANGISVEINPEYHDVPRFLTMCIEEDAFVTLGSNAHTLDQIGTVHGAVAAALA